MFLLCSGTVFAYYRQATSNIMCFVTFLVFSGFHLMLFKFYNVFYDRTYKKCFYFNWLYRKIILLMLLTCVNMGK